MAETEDQEERYNDNTCMFPGCDRPAADTRDRGFGESYKARYCDLDEHNAVNMHQALNEKDEAEA